MLFLAQLLFTGCITIEPPNNPLAIDDDGDGYTEFEGDCDDRDPNTFPGSVTEATSDECMKDSDGDGFGDVEVSGDFDAGTDCDDSNPLTFPGAEEYCNGVDDNCDGTIDESAALDVTTWYEDADGDGFGNDSVSQNACLQPSGYILDNTDCNDTSDATYPGAAQITSSTACMTDADDDGHASLVPVSGAVSGTDCDDSDPYTFRGAGVLDNLLLCMTDVDGDGYGSNNPISGVSVGTDCDDGDSSSTIITEDGDCDGVLSVDDCDDDDSSLLAIAEDGDCDGVLSVDDCDDSDASVVSVCLDLGGGQSMDLVLIPNGTFTMGSPTNEVGRGSDEVQHTVTLTNDYYVMTTEVTQGMFATLMGYNAHDGQTTSNSSGSYGIGNDYPAYYVSWHMAADFANTVTQRYNTLNGTNLQECYACSGSGTGVTCSVSVNPYQCNGYRMLTEAEWEYAARAGTTVAFWTPNGGGNLPSGYTLTTSTLTDGFDLRLYGHYYATYSNPYGSKEVAQLLPNDYGLYDMSGNLWEWTQDYYGTYSTGSVTNPTGLSSSSNRVFRGGRWRNNPYYLRSAERLSSTPTHRSSGVGFRLSRISP